MTDCTHIHHSPTLRRLLGPAAVPTDRTHHLRWSRGVLLGLAAGNVLGLRGEGAWYDEISDRYPAGHIAPDPREKERPMDDDLAQAVEVAETLCAESEGMWYYNTNPAPTCQGKFRPMDDDPSQAVEVKQ